MSKKIFISFLLFLMCQSVFSQNITNGTYKSDSSNNLIYLKLIIKDVDSVRMELVVYDDFYFLNGNYKFKKNNFIIKYHHFNSHLSGNSYNYDKNVNINNVLNLKMKIKNNTIFDTTPIKDVVVFCKKVSSKKILSKVQTKYYKEPILLDIPTDSIPFDIHILSKGNRESIISVTKDFDYSYTLYLAHNIKIFDTKKTVFKTEIQNITDKSFELLINKQIVLMKLEDK